MKKGRVDRPWKIKQWLIEQIAEQKGYDGDSCRTISSVADKELGLILGFCTAADSSKRAKKLIDRAYAAARGMAFEESRKRKRAPRMPSQPQAPRINPNGDAFLSSYEWRRVRMQVLKRDGARCACCGATPADGLRMNVDHIKPRKHFPSLALDMSNLQVLCEICNHGKGNWDSTDWRFKHEPANDDHLTELERQHMRSISEGERGR